MDDLPNLVKNANNINVWNNLNNQLSIEQTTRYCFENSHQATLSPDL